MEKEKVRIQRIKEIELPKKRNELKEKKEALANASHKLLIWTPPGLARDVLMFWR